MLTVRELRYRLALTQGDLAQRAGVARLTVANIERQKGTPIASVRRKIAGALGVEPHQIDWPTAPEESTRPRRTGKAVDVPPDALETVNITTTNS